jgi:hypothetical protein
VSDPGIAQLRAALLDLVLLRRPFEDAAEAVGPYVLRPYRGAPLVRVDRAALRNAIRACRCAALTSRDLRRWALLVHLEIVDPPGHLRRDSFLGWEPRAGLLLHYHLDRLIDAGDNGITDELLDQIERDLEYTDWAWIARQPWAAAMFEFAAVAAWTLLAAWLLAPHLPDSLASACVGTFGAMAVSIGAARLLHGTDIAIERFQRYLPAALLGTAMIGAAYALGGIG